MADRDLIDAVLDELYQMAMQPALDDLAAFAEADRRCKALQERFGGQRHYWPKPDKEPRNIRIASDLRAGHDPQDVAAKHGITPKTVKRAARQAETEATGFGNPDWNLK